MRWPMQRVEVFSPKWRDRIARCPSFPGPSGFLPAAISKHLKVLESAGILHRVKTGKFHRFRLDTRPFTKAQRVMDEVAAFWQQRLDRLEDYLDPRVTPKPKQDK
jgi:hypothetical protein